MRIARLMPLGDHDQRRELHAWMQQHGLGREAKADQARLACVTGGPGLDVNAVVDRLIHCLEQGDWAAAQRCAVERTRAVLGGRYHYHLNTTRLSPGDGSLLDTLGEVHFQRGEFDKARAAARAALRVEPDREFFKKRLEALRKPDAELRKAMGSRPPSVSMH
jgi:hypothetical protein